MTKINKPVVDFRLDALHELGYINYNELEKWKKALSEEADEPVDKETFDELKDAITSTIQTATNSRALAFYHTPPLTQKEADKILNRLEEALGLREPEALREARKDNPQDFTR